VCPREVSDRYECLAWRQRAIARGDYPLQARSFDVGFDRRPYVACEASIHRHMADGLTADQASDRALAGFLGGIEALAGVQRRDVLAVLGHVEKSPETHRR